MALGVLGAADSEALKSLARETRRSCCSRLEDPEALMFGAGDSMAL